MLLHDFNAADAETAASAVAVWAAIPRWVDDVVAGRPYPSVDALADRAATWTRDDLDIALAHHPRIGERATGDGAEAAASAREQSSMRTAGSDVAAAIAAGNAAYEQRFGRVFLIRAAGRSPEEMRAELERRLAGDDDAEAREALTQLAEIAILRLRGMIDA